MSTIYPGFVFRVFHLLLGRLPSKADEFYLPKATGLKAPDIRLSPVVCLQKQSLPRVGHTSDLSVRRLYKSHVNTRLGTDHHQLIMPPISKDCSNTFLERSFIYAAPCEWNKLSEHIRTSNFDCFRKSVKTMLFTQQYGC